MTTRARCGAMLAGAFFGCSMAACVPRLRPLSGAPMNGPLPSTGFTAARHVVLQWELQDPDLVARGEASARLAPPDSARLDFFLGGGMGSGAAVLIGDTLAFPSSADDMGRRLVPPPPLLWAALGRLAVPAAADTVIRVDADTLRADIGRPVAWRATFVRDTLWRLERVRNERVTEWVQRTDAARVRYRQEAHRRQLDLRITRMEAASAFDPSIWILP